MKPKLASSLLFDSEEIVMFVIVKLLIKLGRNK